MLDVRIIGWGRLRCWELWCGNLRCGDVAALAIPESCLFEEEPHTAAPDEAVEEAKHLQQRTVSQSVSQSVIYEYMRKPNISNSAQSVSQSYTSTWGSQISATARTRSVSHTRVHKEAEHLQQRALGQSVIHEHIVAVSAGGADKVSVYGLIWVIHFPRRWKYYIKSMIDSCE